MLAAQGVQTRRASRRPCGSCYWAICPMTARCEELAKKRGQYAAFKGEFLRNPVKVQTEGPTTT
ncbi:Ypt/Rab-GAP domain of gyp1p superfamily protein [Zea mays]|uniref:Ypt/Rab-GAP domain of gyp1p superfamily protein n=1 Tax=Zea mays TaxID=4577 RepID=A0A1D6N406_MAIZE|nr:Ypt/Rab-GAP domain of gyp1p superfamily protein [Zea mays]